MFAATCSEALAQPVGVLILAIAFYAWLAKKFAASNPEVANAAKKAVAGKAIGIIGRLFK